MYVVSFFIKMSLYINENWVINHVDFLSCFDVFFPKVLMVVMGIPMIMICTEHIGMIFQVLQLMSLVLSQQEGLEKRYWKIFSLAEKESSGTRDIFISYCKCLCSKESQQPCKPQWFCDPFIPSVTGNFLYISYTFKHGCKQWQTYTTICMWMNKKSNRCIQAGQIYVRKLFMNRRKAIIS